MWTIVLTDQFEPTYGSRKDIGVEPFGVSLSHRGESWGRTGCDYACDPLALPQPFPIHAPVGQISHESLVRPYQFGEWLDREEARVRAELDSAAAAEVDDAPAAAAVGAGDGIASQIPAHLLERSKAAKARLLGS